MTASIAAAPLRVIDDQAAAPPGPPLWPVLHEEALYGKAGKFVRAAAEGSEADSAALLLSFLTCAGASFGPGCALRMGNNEYPARLFSVLVSSSPAHRGTAFEQVRDIFAAAHEHKKLRHRDTYPTIGFEQLRTGDDLVNVITGSQYEDEEEDDEQKPVALADPYQHHVIAVRDFGSTLRAAQRTNSPLGPMLADAWHSADFNLIDAGRKRLPTRAHIGIIGYVPLDALRALRRDEPCFNTLCSQLLWVLVQRKRLIPSPQSITSGTFTQLAGQLASAIAFAHKQRHVELAPESYALWAQLYPQLSQEIPGALGTMSARADEHVLRLSAIYALLDESTSVLPAHLEAANAVWRYCQASARLAFTETTMGSTATRILHLLSKGPKTQTELHDLFNKHIKAEELNSVLSELQARGLAECCRKGGGPGKGRPMLTWNLSPAVALGDLLQEEPA